MTNKNQETKVTACVFLIAAFCLIIAALNFYDMIIFPLTGGYGALMLCVGIARLREGYRG